MPNLKEDKIEEDIIDFNNLRDPELKESFLHSFGYMVKGLLKAMFGGSIPKTKIRGKPVEVQAFADALASERNYLKALKDYGLDNPRSHKNKAELKSSVKKFESRTGVKWPFEV